MIINAHTIVITLAVIAVAAYFGLRAIRAFALSIAQENHDAVLAMDAKEDKERRRRERDADAALATATAKVAPLLPSKLPTEVTTSAPTGTSSSDGPSLV